MPLRKTARSAYSCNNITIQRKVSSFSLSQSTSLSLSLSLTNTQTHMFALGSYLQIDLVREYGCPRKVTTLLRKTTHEEVHQSTCIDELLDISAVSKGQESKCWDCTKDMSCSAFRNISSNKIGWYHGEKTGHKSCERHGTSCAFYSCNHGLVRLGEPCCTRL